MKQKLLCIFATSLTLYFLSQVTLADTSNQQVTEVPFSFEANRIILKVMINGKGPYNMILATGSPESVIKYDLAKQIGLNHMVFLPDSSITARPVKMRMSLRRLEISGLVAERMLVTVGNINGPSQQLSIPVDGIIGSDFLQYSVMQIDFSKRVLRFSPDLPATNSGNQQGSARRLVLPIRLDKEDFVPVIDEVYINGKKIKAKLDTGFAGTLSLMPDAIKQLELNAEANAAASDNSNPDMRRGQVGNLSVGSFKIDSPATLFYGKDMRPHKEVKDFGAVIGNGFMQGFTVTFYYHSKVAVFEEK